MASTAADIQPTGQHGKGVHIQAEALDIIGDVHGCAEELEALLKKLGWTFPDGQTPFHPQGRLALLVGDLVNRGPRPARTLQLVRDLTLEGRAVCLLGNHDHVLHQWLQTPIQPTPDLLRGTIDDLVEAETTHADITLAQARQWLNQRPWWASCDTPGAEALQVVHASWHPDLPKAGREVLEAACLYGPVARLEPNGPLQRVDWRRAYPEDAPLCVHGHTAYHGPVKERENTVCLDTGCVFGGALSALRWPERKVVQVTAARAWSPYPTIKNKPPLVNPASLPQGQALAWPWNPAGEPQTFNQL